MGEGDSLLVFGIVDAGGHNVAFLKASKEKSSNGSFVVLQPNAWNRSG